MMDLCDFLLVLRMRLICLMILVRCLIDLID